MKITKANIRQMRKALRRLDAIKKSRFFKSKKAYNRQKYKICEVEK